ncbi:MAG: hypothetical protein Kow0059_02900 [Candidatus Sumerlaeia bacterium]
MPSHAHRFVALLLMVAFLLACIPDDVYWLPDNRHCIVWIEQPMVVDTQDGAAEPLPLPDLDKNIEFFSATHDLKRLAVWTNKGAQIYEKTKTGYRKARFLDGVKFSIGRLWSPSGNRLLLTRGISSHQATLSIWNVETGRLTDLTQLFDSKNDITFQCFWVDEDRIVVIQMHDVTNQNDTGEKPLYAFLGKCLLLDLSDETTRTLAANLKIPEASNLLNLVAPDEYNNRIFVAETNSILFIDLDSGQQRRLYPFRLLEAQWPLFFTVISGLRYNPDVETLIFTAREHPDGAGNLYQVDLTRTEERSYNPFPWILSEKRTVRAVAATPLTHFHKVSAFNASPSPHGDKLAYFLDLPKGGIGLVVQRNNLWQSAFIPDAENKMLLIKDLNNERDRLFTTRDEADSANDWAEWAVKIINDRLNEDGRKKTVR